MLPELSAVWKVASPMETKLGFATAFQVTQPNPWEVGLQLLSELLPTFFTWQTLPSGTGS